MKAVVDSEPMVPHDWPAESYNYRKHEFDCYSTVKPPDNRTSLLTRLALLGGHNSHRKS